MGYLVVIRTDRPVERAELEEFHRCVPEYKRCPTRLFVRDKDFSEYLFEPLGAPRSDQIWIGGSYTASGKLYRPYAEHLMRWLRHMKNVRCSGDYS